MVAFFKKWYAPNRMVFIAVGDFDAEEMGEKVKGLQHVSAVS